MDSFSDIKKYRRLSFLLRMRNSRILKAAMKSPLWKKAIDGLRKSALTGFWSEKALRPEKAQLDISYSKAEKAFTHVLRQYDDCVFGYWTAIEVSPIGSIRRIGLFDRVDEEQHKRIFYNLVCGPRRRGGGAPWISASLLRIGTRLIGNDGKRHVVEQTGSTRRWSRA